MKRIMMIIGIGAAVLIAVSVVIFFAAEKYTARPDFCGLRCHTMRNAYDTWKKDKHKMGSHSKIKRDVACVECHYAPGEKATPRAKFRSLGQLFSYLATKDKEVRKRAVVKDVSCLTAECHPKTELMEKKIEYIKSYQMEYKGILLPFVHKTHMEKTIEGQTLHCSSCHVHNTAGKHFEVPKESCFLCHFRKAKENEGRSKCSICHEISKEPLKKKKPGEENDGNAKPITHQSIEKAKVACSSCHFEMVKGSVDVKKEACFECHHNPTPELIKTMDNRKLMHEEHVAKQTARCFNCHQVLEHKKSPYLDAAIKNCATCHPEPHFYQKLIIAGEGGRGVEKFPIAHDAMRTSCLACHTKDGYDEKGRKVRTVDVKNCVTCHDDKDKEKISKKWKADVAEELNTARGVEKEAIAAIEAAKGNRPETVILKAIVKLKNAQENLRIVDAGGGVHNKKYAMLLIETAVSSLEEIKKELKGESESSNK